jgi:mono/diheme cytochrome c family protein
MSTQYTRFLSDEDAQAVIAYLRSQSAVQQDAGGDNPNLLAMIFLGAGLFPEPPTGRGPAVTPTKAATAEYGQYIVGYYDCRICHGDNYTGGTSSLAPHGPNLTAIVPKWASDQFIHRTFASRVTLDCHPEQSEGSLSISAEILRFTQNDKRKS